MQARKTDAAGGRWLFGYHFSPDTTEQVVNAALPLPEPNQGVRLVVTANLDHIVLLQSNSRLRDAYTHAWLRTIDGTPVFLYARARGIDIAERVTGADIFPMLLDRFDPARHRPFFVAANEQIVDGLGDWAADRGFPSGAVATDIPPFGFEDDADYGARLAARIRDHGTTHLFFGVGCPRSEIWINEHRNALGDVYAFAVGAALGFFVGTEQRAPRLMRRLGMEWAWRVLHDPGRLAQRYFVRSWGFAAAVLRDLRQPKVAGR